MVPHQPNLFFFINFCYLPFDFAEQGCRNDLFPHVVWKHLHQGSDLPMSRTLRVRITLNSTKARRSLVAILSSSSNLISDRVHWDPLSFLAYGSRCHTVDDLKEISDVELSQPSPAYSYLNTPPPGSMCSRSHLQTLLFELSGQL